jgi:hypothetical protein
MAVESGPDFRQRLGGRETACMCARTGAHMQAGWSRVAVERPMRLTRIGTFAYSHIPMLAFAGVEERH